MAFKGMTPFLARCFAGVLEARGVQGAVIRADQEKATVALTRAAKVGRKQPAVLTSVPRYAHAAVGAAGRANQTAAAQP